ncbi:MAG: L,D-transpeptidase [Chloroflexales bacterium]|nr:L,D-transpeptidase [Chloroflexales bacterium]
MARPADHAAAEALQPQRSLGNQGLLRLASEGQHAPTSAEIAAPRALASPAPLRIMRAPAEPYISQINVFLTSPQHVTVDWQGSAPQDIRSTFRCSTGKGYGDPDDPPGVCNRSCCRPGANPCASPNEQRGARGSCCTPVGDFSIQHKDRDHSVEGGTIPFWMYFYRQRGIALHEYSPVDGTPLSHGCVRLDSVNAEMLFTYSHANVTRVHVEGSATPACPTGSGVACGTTASLEQPPEAEQLASAEREEADVPA